MMNITMASQKNIASPSLKLAAAILAATLFSGALAVKLHPTLTQGLQSPDISAGVPVKFGEWRDIPTNSTQVNLVVQEGEEKTDDTPYDQTVTRTYINPQGAVVMLALAYANTQRQEVKIHRPDLCYPSQGYAIVSYQAAELRNIRGSHGAIQSVRMLAKGRDRIEAVSYWVRTGSIYSVDLLASRMHILSEGLQGRVPDGILVRASRIIESEKEADRTFIELEAFLAQMTDATSTEVLPLLVR